MDRHLAAKIKQYVKEHKGCAVFTQSEGLLWCKKFLQKHFGDCVPWKGGGYYRAKHKAVQGNAQNVQRVFGADSKSIEFSVKSCMLEDVPISQRCYATTEGTQLFGGRYGDMFPSEPGRSEANGDGT